MPIYEYQCTNCNNVFEQWCKCSELEDFISCPLCSAPSKHIISNTAFVLKGTGWYVTEYGNKKNSPDKGEEPKKDAIQENASPKNADVKSTPDNNKVSASKPALTETNSPSTIAQSSTNT